MAPWRVAESLVQREGWREGEQALLDAKKGQMRKSFLSHCIKLGCLMVSLMPHGQLFACAWGALALQKQQSEDISLFGHVKCLAKLILRPHW